MGDDRAQDERSPVYLDCAYFYDEDGFDDASGEKISRRKEETSNDPELRARTISQTLCHGIRRENLAHHLVDQTFFETLDLAHDRDYLEFLRDAFSSAKASRDRDWFDPESQTLVPNHFWPSDGTVHPQVPVYKLSGAFGRDVMTPIRANTWKSAISSAKLAWVAARYVCGAPEELSVSEGKLDRTDAAKIAYVLAGAPGHHSARRRYGGYCFLNNAALAALELRRQGAGPVGILDLDLHAGDGILEIVETQDDLWAVSIHADPRREYPSFAGFPGKSGTRGQCLSIVAPDRCDKRSFLELLKEAVEFLKAANVRSLVVAFGADTFALDPNVDPEVRFSLELDDYFALGSAVRDGFDLLGGGLSKGVVVTQEGGYSMENVGKIAHRFLLGLANLPLEFARRADEAQDSGTSDLVDVVPHRPASDDRSLDSIEAGLCSLM